MLTDKNQSLIISFLTLRKLIGILGMCLPFACLVGGSWLPALPALDSISAYYHSSMRDFFVGLIVGVSMFLVTYKGHERRDTIVAVASGVAGLGIALFPCTMPGSPASPVGIFQLAPGVAGTIHYASAGVFFMLLAINSFFLFTIGDKKHWTSRKSVRNAIYRTCGVVMFASLAALGILWLALGKERLDGTVWTLALETVMLVAFGISWLVKGETIFRDRPGERTFDLTRAEGSGR